MNEHEGERRAEIHLSRCAGALANSSTSGYNEDDSSVTEIFSPLDSFQFL